MNDPRPKNDDNIIETWVDGENEHILYSTVLNPGVVKEYIGPIETSINTENRNLNNLEEDQESTNDILDENNGENEESSIKNPNEPVDNKYEDSEDNQELSSEEDESIENNQESNTKNTTKAEKDVPSASAAATEIAKDGLFDLYMAAMPWSGIITVIGIVVIVIILLFVLSFMGGGDGGTLSSGSCTSNTIVLDAGHPSESSVTNDGIPSGENGGASGNDINEKEKTLEIASSMKQILESKGYRVIMTRTDNSTKVTNEERAIIANNANAELLFRIHNNSSENANARGFSMYYPEPNASLNGAGVIVGPSVDIAQESKNAASTIYNYTKNKIKNIGSGLPIHSSGLMSENSTSVGASNGGALRGSIFSKVPVMLIEVGFLSNTNDANWLKEENNITELSKILSEGISSYVGTGECSSSNVATKAATIAHTEYLKGVSEGCYNGCNTNINIYQSAGGCGSGAPWCAAFMSYIFQRAGATDLKTCSAIGALNFFGKDEHQILDINTNKPMIGDLIYRPREGGSGHVGIVYRVDGTTLHTIEGNSGDALKMKTYPNLGIDSWTKLGRY